MDKKERGIEKLNARSTDIRSELDKLLKTCQHMRECLEKSLFQGMGHKQDGVSDSDVRALSALSIALDRVVAAKIKFDKHMKAFAEQMTPTEELEAITEHLLALESDKRARWLNGLIKRHNALLKASGQRMNLGSEDIYDDETR